MDFFGILSMVGGLALFLYGMHLLGEGLSSVSGGRLEKILERMTNNPIKAVALGAGVTALIQSSSATTVMVVGFVNSGIMKLSQAVGIIMGANIGTTVTSWILSLSGIESSNFFIQLLKPTSFSPVLALVGVCMLLFSKKEKKHNIGTILIGFAVLMYGMDAMSEAVKPLADVPAFTGMLTKFSNPVLGLLAGTILTAVIQSSSASVGILQALCKTGAVSYATAIPIIMGQNIGTCITAILSAIGAKKNAKRAATIHLMFNMIGTVLFLTVFYTLNLFVHFAFLGENAAPVGIAMIHTIFNVTVTLVLLPFNQMLVKLAYVVIPVTDDEKSKNSGKLTILDERFLEVPGYALEISETAALTMFQEVRRSLGMSETLIKNYQPDTVVEMKDSEELVDGYENQISNYLLALSHKGINEAESQKLSVLLYTVNDIETISDQVCNIGIAYRGLDAKENAFSEMALDELSILQELETELVDKTIEMFHAKGETMLDVYACRHLLLDLSGKVKERHMSRLIKNKCSMEVGIVLTDILNSYERISLRCLRIANYLSQKDKKSLTIHDLETMLPESEYHAEYEQYKAKYQLA